MLQESPISNTTDPATRTAPPPPPAIQRISVLAEVLIVGGSATLAEPLVELTKGRFKIAKDPQFANLRGMLL